MLGPNATIPLLCLISMLAAGEAKEKVIFGRYELEYPPHHYRDGEDYVGPDMAITVEAFRRMKDFELVLETMPLGRALRAHQAGTIDVLYLFKDDPPPEAHLYAEVPLRWTRYELAVLPNQVFSFDVLADIYGKSIGALQWLVIGSDLDDAAAENKLNVERTPSYASLLQMLSRGRIDAVLGSPDVVGYEATKMGVALQYIEVPNGQRRGFFAKISEQSKLKNKDLLLQLLSEKFLEMQADGTYKKIYAQFDMTYNNDA